MAPRPHRKAALLGGKPAFASDIYVSRPPIPDLAEFSELVAKVFSSRWLTNAGPLSLELERELGEFLAVPMCLSFCNGTAALLTALRALGLKGEVITTPFTFPATPHCIEWNGLTPVFCDVDPETYNLDPRRLAEVISPKTSAVLPVHVFGNPCDVEAIQSAADRAGLKVIYDAAHAFGVTLQGRSVGTWGDLSALSFHATKSFHTAEGGAIVAGSKLLEDEIRLLRNFGIASENEVHGVGLNGKLSELHSALGLLVLKMFDQERESRGRLTAHYHERLRGIEGLTFQRIVPGTGRNYFNFTVQIDEQSFGLSRDQVHAALKPEHIVTRKYFHPICSENECYRDLPSARPELLPHAYRLSSRILSLPLYGTLTTDDVDLIADSLLAVRAEAKAVQSALV